MPKKPLKDPKGGLTAAGRAHFKETEGANLKPGVKGPANTPEKQQRKGSFLRRHFANPNAGPLTDDKGKPTRHALSAQAWGEPLPKTDADVKTLAKKGSKLLEQARGSKTAAKPAKASAKKAPAAKPAKGVRKKDDESEVRLTLPWLMPEKKSPSKTKASAAAYTQPELRERLKKKITAGDKGGQPGQWSARKAQLLAAEYKKAGGEYKKGSPTDQQKHLKSWTQEKWQTKDGKKAQQGKTTSRYLPKKAWDKLTPAEKKATDEKKKSASRTGKQFVANTPAAKKARTRAQAKG